MNPNMPAFSQSYENELIPIGITNRAWIAMQFPIRQDEGLEFGIEGWGQPALEQLIGSAMPGDYLELMKWSAIGEAKLRLLKADALIEEINRGKT